MGLFNKTSKKKRKKKQSIRFNSEYHNLITIFLGVFLLYSLNSSSMGWIPVLIQNVFKGLFGGLSIFIPILLIVTGILGFMDGNEYIYRFRKTKVYFIAVFFIFVFYGLLHAGNLVVDSPFQKSMMMEIVHQGVAGNGCGLISTIIVYYMCKIFGVFGAWLVSIFALLIASVYTFNISVSDMIAKFKETKNSGLSTKERLAKMKDAALNLVTDEVDDIDDKTVVAGKEKKGLFGGLKEKFSKEEAPEEEDYDNVDDKTIKIVGFNKADDDYLEILEGTQSMSELDVLKELQEADIPADKSDLNALNRDGVSENTGIYSANAGTAENRSAYADKNNDIDINTTGNGDSYKNYRLPSPTLLNKVNKKSDENVRKKVIKNAELLERTLEDFGVDASISQVTVGPAITRYEIQPKPGVKVSKIVNLTDDIALSLAARSIRVEAPIPGKNAIGIEVPNDETQMVGIREIVESDEFKNFKSPLAMGLGKDVSGKIFISDIAKMPHLLIAGSTGSGKSVCVNTLINSILFKARPDEVKLLLIDPKVVELSNYNGIPHLLIPVVTDPSKAANALNWAVTEMNRRYKLFSESGSRDIKSYNEKAEEKLPSIVIIIDELADLMMTSAKEVEDYICRLAQKARAAGMHLVIATQRPSVDVITGVIKANIPSRIAFAVSSRTDSRTILDMGGAEKLLGKGDMLFHPLGASKPERLQGAFISEGELEKVIDFVKGQFSSEEVKYEEDIIESISAVKTTPIDDEDELLPQAIEFVVDTGQASASMLQRRFKIGFNRAARIIDSMEERGIVGQNEGSRPRKVLISKEQYEEIKK
ncbi:DNA translocase FtsK [Peptacetobacter hominis]|uniref:DNA translocase FtsK n=1 Tax=Peptacetobacter hominis TaxID=2743610 RepID=A0A544QTY9_9FIRM|nr:DNA translocase FtsK [Peptacetobacter hominis]TQQ84158.1 DNA translocase FtsK [Peptacetobacter hominis]